jgi:putative membrane protein
MQWWCAAQGTAWSWTWQPYPGVWLFVALLAGAYTLAHRRYGDADDGFSPGFRRGSAGAGILLLWIALDWPVGALGAGYLASVHMVQFLLIAVAAPPLLLLGTPRRALERAMEIPPVGLAMRVLGYPIMAICLFTAVMGLTHWPLLADTLMSRQWGSFVLDMMWLASGLVFWWPVAVNLPEREWLQEPFKMGYLIVATLVNTGVFAFLTFSSVPVYATFELAPPVGSLSTRDDQLVAGLLMKVGGALVLWSSITVLWFRWYRRSQDDGPASASTRRAVPLAVAAVSIVAGLGGCGGSEEDAVERERAVQDAAERMLGPAARGFRPVADGALGLGPVVIGEPVTPERAALYAVVEDRSGEGDVLEAVAVDGVAESSLHRTLQDGGMMRMERVPGGFHVPGDGVLRMEPGGDHVMLEGITTPLREGMVVMVELDFRDAGRVSAVAEVVGLTELGEALRR